MALLAQGRLGRKGSKYKANKVFTSGTPRFAIVGKHFTASQVKALGKVRRVG